MKSLAILHLNAKGVIVSVWTVAALAGAADDRIEPEWKASCQSNGLNFSITFKAQTPGDDQGDMKVTASAGGKEIPISMPVALYKPRGMVSDVENVCDQI